MSGDFSALNAAYLSSNIDGLGNEIITISDSSIDASFLNTLDEKTTGIINASTVTNLSGDFSALNTAYESSTISGLGDETITISDTSIDSSVINTLDEKTTGIIDASAVTSMSGIGSDIVIAYSSSGINGLGDETITISDLSLIHI